MNDTLVSRARAQKPTLNQLFFRIVLIGIGALGLVSAILMQQERRQLLQRWQSDAISHSAAVLSSYYSILITKLILNQTADVENILVQTQKSEELREVKIVSPAEVTTAVLETCNIDYSKAFFHQTPTCFETTTDVLRVYHELRSAGHSVGYLMKEIPLPRFPLLSSTAVVPYMLVVVFCFLGVNVIVLFYFRRYVMRPAQQIVESLNQHRSITLSPQECSCQELDTLAVSLEAALGQIADYQERTTRLEYDAKIGQLASQVAHDVRSPLTALKVLCGHLAEVPEERRVMIRNAVQRIDDIAYDLVGQKAGTQSAQTGQMDEAATSVQLLSSLIEPLISEKRTQQRGKLGVEIHAELDADSYGLFAAVQPVEFKRVISNLINNAAEAMERGLVVAAMRQEVDHVVITVTDTGKGIPPDVLPRLMQQGATFGKVGGSGLGLYHARTTVERWGGSLVLTSTVGVGTTVTITLPCAEAPAWFVPELQLMSGSIIVIVDDDVSIHQIWQERLEALDLPAHEITLQHFSSGTDVTAWYQGQTNTFFLCDYEFLGMPNNGLELIEQLGVHDRAILVTSHYEEAPIQQRCADLGVRLIPKGLAGFVPICIRETTMDQRQPTAATAIPAVEAQGPGTDKPAALVLDDDEAIRFVWPMEGRRLGLGTVRTFASMEACEAAGVNYAQFDFAFVDKNIPGSVWHLDQVITHLKSCGVKKVLVASGESARALANDPLCVHADGVIPMKIPQKLPR